MAPPTSPTTIAANGKLIDEYLSKYISTYLPKKYSIIVTSGYRDPEKNREVGGATDSAHLYNLARDFVFTYSDTGQVVPEPEALNIYNDYFRNWNGYTLFEQPDRNDKTYHVHVNLPRDYSKVGSYFTTALVIAGGLFGARFLLSKLKRKT